MCGIFSFVNLKRKPLDIVKLFKDFNNLKHRGPDNSYFESYNNVLIGFHRLAIMDDSFTSNQPFILEDNNRTVIFICNGEIYNFNELIEAYNLPSYIKNDCAVLIEIYFDMARRGYSKDFPRFVRENVKGEYAFVLFEFDNLKNLRKIITCRDEIGIRPLYYHPLTLESKALIFTSEVKGALEFEGDIQEFPPGHIFTYHFDELGNVNVEEDNLTTIYFNQIFYGNHLENVRRSVLNSVRRRLNADKPFAFLLSGGVDSSLVAALSAKILGKPIRTFCCGLKSESGEGVGTDLKFARMVADHIGSNHTEVLFTPEEGLAAIPDVIRSTETWCTTSIRASVGQYLVCKHIGKKTDCKVVMVGEGPDEVCSSYLFNWNCPSGQALDACAKEYVRNIHYYDVKRADRNISYWGLEGRVPLLDPEFIKAYWSIPGEQRMPTFKGMEKWWLREAFKESGVLPEQVLFRRKEAFSDGVSGEKSWYQIIQEWIEDKVTDEELASAGEKYPFCTPQTKEAYYYRKVFCEIFGEHRQNIIPGYWQPKWNKDGKEVKEYIDPSARTLEVYTSLT